MSIEPSSDAIRWKQLTKLFDDLSDGDAATRQQELNALRLRDPVLATELENMLRADASLGGVLDQDLHQFAGTLISEAAMSATDSNSLEQTHVNQKIGDFELQKRIGEGGMGEVWLAKRDTDGFVQQVALKLLKRGMDSDELSRRFARERKILAQLDHPHIARFVDGGASADGRLYYAMELVDGQSLTAFCKSQSLDLRQRLAVFLKVVAAVAHAQNQSVVHRDLKPSNILIDTQGNPRLLDFGIAKMLTESSLDVETQTAAELRALSPAYAAPEQILGEPISNATDVFALGVILFELLTDERPHQRSGNLSALALQVSNENADSMGATIKRRAQSEKISKLERAQTQGWRRHIDADLEVIVSTAMQRDPKRRYQSAAELAEDLQRWVNHQPIRAQADSMTYRARKFVARHRYAVGSASAVLLALIAGFGAALWQANVARQQAKRAEVELQRTQTIKDFTLSLFREQDPFARSTAAARTPSELIRLGLERAQSQFENDPTLRLALLDDLAEIQMALGDHAPALEQLKKKYRGAASRRQHQRRDFCQNQGSHGNGSWRFGTIR